MRWMKLITILGTRKNRHFRPNEARMTRRSSRGRRLVFESLERRTLLNADPIANDDTGAGFTTNEDTSFITANVLENDTDSDTADVLGVLTFNTTGTRGVVTDNGDGTFNYDPNGQFESVAVGTTDTDAFTYTVSDGNGGTDTATVTITINGINDTPVATNDSFEVNEGAFSLGNVIRDDAGNGVDFDVDRDPATLAPDTLRAVALNDSGFNGAEIALLPSGAVVTLQSTGNFVYNHFNIFDYLAVNETATDSFSYTVSDLNDLTMGQKPVWGHWSLDDGVSGLVDMAGTGSDLTLEGDASFTTGQIDGALDLDGSGDYAVSAGFTSLTTETTIRTMAAWIKTNSTGPNDAGIMSWGATTGGEKWVLRLDDDHLRLETDNGAIESSRPSGSPATNDGEWHHVAVVFNTLIAGESHSSIQFYVDGVLQNTGENSNAAVNAADFSDIRIGTDRVSEVGGSSDFNGQIDDVAMWGRVLTPAEIALIYESGAASGAVNDSFQSMATASVTITINGINDAPEMQTATFDVEENSLAGTVVGTVDASDVDASDVLSYSIDDTRFDIDANGQITVNGTGVLDFETEPVITAMVTVDDGNGGTDTETFTIKVLDVTAMISGTVYVDANQNGVFDGGSETGIDGVTIKLFDSGGTLLGTDTTSMGGVYAFEVNDEFGTYRIVETQPTVWDDGNEIAGSGAVSFTLNPGALNDVIELTLGVDADNSGQPDDARDWDFSEKGEFIAPGDTATIGFWQNKNGQELIDALDADGGLEDWLLDNFDNIFDQQDFDAAGGVADLYRDEFFKKKLKDTPKVDAQFMALAFAAYATSSNLAGNVATSFGFDVTETGISTKVVNVGDSGEAFGVDDNSDMRIIDMLQATDLLTGSGADLLYDSNADNDIDDLVDVFGDGSVFELESTLRVQANEIYSALNEQGDI